MGTENIIGNKYNMLTVIEKAEKKNNKEAYLCRCDCGNYKIIAKTDLINNNIKSCGCLLRKNARKNLEKINSSGMNKKTNKYDLSGSYGIGYTYNGNKFFFDLDDYALIKDYSWHFTSRGYLEASSNINGVKCNIMMHRLIMGVIDKNDYIDHINHDKFDNRKSNLRIVSNSQNQMNKGIVGNNTSGHRGVSFNQKTQKWFAYICKNNKHIHLGCFDKIEDAIRKRKEAESVYFGEYNYAL